MISIFRGGIKHTHAYTVHTQTNTPLALLTKKGAEINLVSALTCNSSNTVFVHHTSHLTSTNIGKVISRANVHGYENVAKEMLIPF